MSPMLCSNLSTFCKPFICLRQLLPSNLPLIFSIVFVSYSNFPSYRYRNVRIMSCTYIHMEILPASSMHKLILKTDSANNGSHSMILPLMSSSHLSSNSVPAFPLLFYLHFLVWMACRALPYSHLLNSIFVFA